MKVTCDNCKSEYALSDWQRDFILRWKNRGKTLAMLECGVCGFGHPVNPQDLGGVVVLEAEFSWVTPLSGVYGFVSFVDNEGGEGGFYGCGETGKVWSTKEEFYIAIEQIIERYPHRALFYRKENEDWFPVEEEGSVDFEKLIDSEVSEYFL